MTKNNWITSKWCRGLYCDGNEIDKENLRKIHDVAAHKPQTRMKWCWAICDCSWLENLEHTNTNVIVKVRTKTMLNTFFCSIRSHSVLFLVGKAAQWYYWVGKTIYKWMSAILRSIESGWKNGRLMQWLTSIYWSTYIEVYFSLLIVLATSDIFVYLENSHHRNHWSDGWLEANTNCYLAVF